MFYPHDPWTPQQQTTINIQESGLQLTFHHQEIIHLRKIAVTRTRSLTYLVKSKKKKIGQKIAISNHNSRESRALSVSLSCFCEKNPQCMSKYMSAQCIFAQTYPGWLEFPMISVMSVIDKMNNEYPRYLLSWKEIQNDQKERVNIPNG